MSIFDTIPHWSFDGIAFARIIDSDSWPTWFESETIRQVDPIVGSTDRYVDIGGRNYQPIQLRAAFASSADRSAMQAKQDHSGTLTNIQGVSGTALLVKVAVLSNSGGPPIADLTFEL